MNAGSGALSVLLPFVILVSSSVAQPVPRAPRLLEARAPLSLGRTLLVAADGDFQKALDDALPGDTIELAAGEVFEGPFTLPRKTGQGTIVVRTSARDGDLPSPGSRVSPSHAGAMPKLQSSADVVVRAAPGARGYHFIGIEIRPRPGHALVNLVDLGTEAPSFADLPADIVFERCYLHGDPERGSRRGIAMNSRETAVIDSFLSDFKDANNEAQAIAGWTGPGPFKIVNNYLEGAGENVMFGGGDPPIPGLVPADIEIRRNHLRKPLHWKADDPSYDGTRWVVKNLLELKNARRVLIEGNLLENNWRAAQNGIGILFTVRNQNGRSPWSVVEDITFVNNHLRNSAGGINILGRDRTWPSGSGQTRRILIRNNLFEDIGGMLFQLLDQTADIVIDHNTALNSSNIANLDSGPHTGFVFRNNIALHNQYGFAGTAKAPGNDSIESFLPGAVIRRNVLVGADAARYPGDNFFPASLSEVGFVDLPGGNFHLASTSPFRGAGTDGRDPGVDIDELAASLAGAAGGASEDQGTASPPRLPRSPH